MPSHFAVPTLMFVTLGIALIIGVGAFAWHMRKKTNRHPMEGERDRTMNEINDGPDRRG